VVVVIVVAVEPLFPVARKLRLCKREWCICSIACLDYNTPDGLEVVRIMASNSSCRVGDETVDVVAEAIVY